MSTHKATQTSLSDLSSRALATRRKLKDSARTLINDHGYSNVRVEDITTAAGVAKGLFYRYFTDLNHITYELCQELFEDVLAQSLEKSFDGNSLPYDWLYQYVLIPVERFISNCGLLACMFELHGSFPEISKAWTTSARRWNLHLTEFIRQASGVSKADAERFCYVLGAAMEGIIYQSTIRNMADIKSIGSSAEDIAETIALTWYRFIFLDVPPNAKAKAKFLLASGKRQTGTGSSLPTS